MTEKWSANSSENDYAARLQAMRRMPIMRFVTMPIGHTIPGYANRIQGDERQSRQLNCAQRLALRVGNWLVGLAEQVPTAEPEAQPSDRSAETTWCGKVVSARQRELFENYADQVIAEALNELQQERQFFGPPDPDQSKTKPKLNFAAPPPLEVAAADHVAGVVDQIAAELVAAEGWLVTMELFEDEDGLG